MPEGCRDLPPGIRPGPISERESAAPEAISAVGVAGINLLAGLKEMHSSRAGLIVVGLPVRVKLPVSAATGCAEVLSSHSRPRTLEKLHAAITEAVKDTEMQKRWIGQGVVRKPTTRAKFAAIIKSGLAEYRKVVRESSVVAEKPRTGLFMDVWRKGLDRSRTMPS